MALILSRFQRMRRSEVRRRARCTAYSCSFRAVSSWDVRNWRKADFRLTDRQLGKSPEWIPVLATTNLDDRIGAGHIALFTRMSDAS